MGESSPCTALLSNTVSISHLEDWDVSLEELVEDLSRLGDLARVDASLAGTLRRILVTYFDVRAAQQALVEYAGQAEPFAPMQHDCRVVRVSQAAFEKVCSGRNLRSFGEVANVSIFLGHITIEFYDIRAAQKLMVAADGTAIPVPLEMLQEMFAQQSHQPQEAPQEISQAPQGTPQQLLQQLLQLALHQQDQQKSLQLQQALPTPPHEDVMPQPPPEIMRTPYPQVVQQSLREAEVSPAPGLVHPDVVGESISSPLTRPVGVMPSTGPVSLDPSVPAALPAGSNPSDSPGMRRGTRGGRSRAGAVHTKVSVWDFAKFDIDLDRIRRGQDPRTTVMVRNLSGVDCRKTFLAFLEHCGLGDRYTFIHMPCKEHRRVLAGFAFINFCSPDDVHVLFQALKRGGLNEYLGGNSAKVPSMSYARFQGLEELVKLFSTTAVLHEQDPEKRPLFRKNAGRTPSVCNKTDSSGVPHSGFTVGNMGLALGG